MPASRAGSDRLLAKADVSFVDMRTRTAARATRQVSIRFTETPGLVDARANRVIMASVVEQIAVERNKAAVELRDQGRIEEARRALLANAAYLRESARRYESKALAEYVAKNEQDASRLEGEAWTQQRKAILDEQNIRQTQQAPRER